MLLGHAVDGRADIFSLGVLVYEMLTGGKPFLGDSLAALYHQTLSVDPLPPSSVDREIGSAWDSVVARMLAKRPENRYACASELLEDLRALQAGRPPKVAMEEAGERSNPLTLADSGSIPEPVLDRVIADAMRDASGRPTVIAPAAKALVAFVTVTGFALFVILGAYLFRPPEGTAGPQTSSSAARTQAAPAAEPADVELRLAHNLKTGRLGVIVDGRSLFTAPFKGERGRIKSQGALTRTFQVPPGRHVFKVTVADDNGRTWSGIATRRVEAGTKVTLFVEVKGILRRSLDLTWY
jgi:serine/threonine-protein kinase